MRVENYAIQTGIKLHDKYLNTDQLHYIVTLIDDEYLYYVDQLTWSPRTVKKKNAS